MKKMVDEILKKFFVEIEIYEISPLTGGLINETLLAQTDKGQFVLQKINQKIFSNTAALLENKIKVVVHLKAKRFPTASFIQTLTQEYFCTVDDQIWQISAYIPSKTIEKLNSKIAFKTGELLAKFHEVLLDFPIDVLEFTIRDFHNTQKRYDQLINTLAIAPIDRVQKARNEIDFLIENYHKIKPLVDAVNNAQIPIRVVHNDTKVANILFDEDENPICFIDFDTLMPGCILHDIGDALRSGTNSSDENEKDLEKVFFEKLIYDTFLEGYLSIARSFVSEIELKNIHLALPLMLFEQATRFLEDYLNYDNYYSVDYSEHNLNRAKTQIKLLNELKF